SISQRTVSTPQALSCCSSLMEENRETPITRRATPARSDARLAIRASVGPILPPTPRTMMSPCNPLIARMVLSAGSLRSVSSSSTLRIDLGRAAIEVGSLQFRTCCGTLIVLEGSLLQADFASFSTMRFSPSILYEAFCKLCLQSCAMSSKPMRPRTTTKADIPAGMRLKEIAGWNQTEADWQRFLHAVKG